jgi:RNA 2',3'-cyclic 3'-phosphodiesterase
MSQPTPTVRSFIAVELPDTLCSLLSSTQERLRQELGHSANAVRWVRPEGIHLTLQFLGDVPQPTLAEIETRLRAACRGAHRIDMQLDHLGVFPNPRRPCVVWVGLRGELDELHALERAIERQLAPLGFKPDKPFNPHLTLGRVREQARPDEVRAISETVAGLSLDRERAISFTADAVSLMKSDLQPGGAVYTQLARVELDGSPS